MNSELRSQHHKKLRFALWTVVYVLIAVAVLGALFLVAKRIKTHTLPVGSIELIIPHSQYVVGEPITFQIVNKMNADIYVQNKCPTEPLEVYKQKGTTWVRLHETTSEKNCPKENRQVAIPASSTMTGNFLAWPNLFKEPGKYRIVALVEHYNAIPYQDFEIIVPPAPAPEPAPAIVQQTTSGSSGGGSSSGSNQQTLRLKTISVSGGSLSVQYSSSRIYVLSISPNRGCVYEGGRSGPSVEVTFKCGQSQTQLNLSLRSGQLVQNVETGGD